MFDSFWRRDTMNLNTFLLLSQRIWIIRDILRHPLLESNILFSGKQITSWTVEDSIFSIQESSVIRRAISFKAAGEWEILGYQKREKIKQKSAFTLEGICFCWYWSEGDQARIANASWTNTSPCPNQKRTCRNLQHKNRIGKCRLHGQSWNLSWEHREVDRIPHGYSIHSTWEERRYSLIRFKCSEDYAKI